MLLKRKQLFRPQANNSTACRKNQECRAVLWPEWAEKKFKHNIIEAIAFIVDVVTNATNTQIERSKIFRSFNTTIRKIQICILSKKGAF